MDEKVNSQITDAVTQTNVSVVGGSSAQSMGMIYQSMAHSMSLLMQNSVAAQGGMQQLNTAIIASSCQQLMNQRPMIVMPQQTPNNGEKNPTQSSKQSDLDEDEGEETPIQRSNQLHLEEVNEFQDLLEYFIKKADEAVSQANQAAVAASEASSKAHLAAEEAHNLKVEEDKDEDKNKATQQIAEYATDAATAANNTSRERDNAMTFSIGLNQAKNINNAKLFLRQTDIAASKAKDYQEEAEKLAQDASDEFQQMKTSLSTTESEVTEN